MFSLWNLFTQIWRSEPYYLCVLSKCRAIKAKLHACVSQLLQPNVGLCCRDTPQYTVPAWLKQGEKLVGLGIFPHFKFCLITRTFSSLLPFHTSFWCTCFVYDCSNIFSHDAGIWGYFRLILKWHILEKYLPWAQRVQQVLLEARLQSVVGKE